ARLQAAVRVDASLELGGLEQLAYHLLKGCVEAREFRFADGESGRHGVAAEAHDEVGLALGDEIERVAQVQAGDRAPGALELAVVGTGEGNGGAVQLFLDAAGDD